MKTDFKSAIQEAIHENLKKNGIELLDLIEIPAERGGGLRVRTLEEILADFDQGDASISGRTVSYVIRAVRPEAKTEPSVGGPAIPDRPLDGIYGGDGRMNLDLLERNAVILLKAGDYALAKNIYTTILKTGDRNADAHLGLGRCHEGLGDYARAQAHYEESVAFAPSPAAFRAMAKLLLRQGKNEYAIEVMERSLKLGELGGKERFELHKACGNRLARLSRVDESEAHFMRALELDPAADDVRANLGTLYLQHGRIADAKRAYQDAVASNPSNARAQFGLGICWIAESKKEHAHDCFARALKHDPKDSNAVYHLMKCAYELKKYDSAERLISEYAQSAPVSASLLYGLAGLKFHVGKKEEAKSLAMRILQMKPDHAGASELLRLVS